VQAQATPHDNYGGNICSHAKQVQETGHERLGAVPPSDQSAVWTTVTGFNVLIWPPPAVRTGACHICSNARAATAVHTTVEARLIKSSFAADEGTRALQLACRAEVNRWTCSHCGGCQVTRVNLCCGSLELEAAPDMESSLTMFVLAWLPLLRLQLRWCGWAKPPNL
jgi:hypothetical protein